MLFSIPSPKIAIIYKIIYKCLQEVATGYRAIFQKVDNFSMLCNMRSKLIPTDRIYIHKYRNLSVDTFFNPHMYLKRLTVYATHNNTKMERFWVVRQKETVVWTLANFALITVK